MTQREAFLDGRVTVHPGDCREVLASIPDASIDSVVTDPPYALVSIGKRFGADGAKPTRDGDVFSRSSAGFMGKRWDTGEAAFAVEFWREVYRVLKPGGQIAGFGGTRSHHRMWVAIEDAGFEIRDSELYLFDLDPVIAKFVATLSTPQRDAFLYILDQLGPGGLAAWVYGSGFPKSHDVAKGIDKHLRKTGGKVARGPAVKRMIPAADQHKAGWKKTDGREYQPADYVPGSHEAAAWQGWGTALKPAWEPIVLARKPLIGSVAANVLAHGTGAINVDGCRVGTDEKIAATRNVALGSSGAGVFGTATVPGVYQQKDGGRFPSNLIHDGSEAVVAMFPGEAGAGGPASGPSLREKNTNVARGTFNGLDPDVSPAFYADSGSAARFIYTAKADDDDRIGSKHPTVKPVDLMQWLCRLITPPGGLILDPFAGTGTTGEAAWREGFSAVLIEREAEYQTDIAERMRLCLSGPIEKRREILKRKGHADYAAGPLFGEVAE